MSSALSGVYVDLDSLLDTRIGTLAKLGGNELVLNVLKGNYHSRQDDKFPGVNLEQYKALYASRDVETLTLSTLTNVMWFLGKIVTELMKQALVRPFHEGVRVVLNTYPYQLTEEDQASMKGILAAKMNGYSTAELSFELETVYQSDAELTPEYCKLNFSAMLMYNFDHWLTLHQVALTQLPMNEVTLYAPALYHVHTPTEEQISELKTRFHWSPFEALEKSVNGGVNLQLMPVELFSIVKPE